LNRSRLIALQGYLPERCGTPILVWIAEYDAVGDITALHLDAPPVALRELRHLEDAHIFHGIWEAADMRIARRGISERQGPRARPRSSQQITVAVWIESSPQRGHRLCPGYEVGTLHPGEEQAAQVVGHCDRKRPATFVPEHAIQRPSGDQLVEQIMF